jgi:hypothetical protein
MFIARPISECLELYEKHVQKLAKEIYIENEYLVLNVGCEYDISLSSIDNPIKLVWWIHHLSEKNWFTTAHAGRLIELATEHMGIAMYEGEGK